jgi:cytochrome c oxidase cbb3-type subunit 3
MKRSFPRAIFAGALVVFTACKRETRDFQGALAPSAKVESPRLSPLQPGQPTAPAAVKNGYEENAYAISEGKNLYSAFNCVGCHAHGGGNIGPALMDATWRYGERPEQIFSSIMDGRPNGMPSFRGRITDQQGWQLAAYVRSLSGLVRKDVAPNREDHMKANPPENSVDPVKPTSGGEAQPHSKG